MHHPALLRSRNPSRCHWKHCDVPGLWDDDDMMFRMSHLCQQLVTLVLELDIPRSFPLFPHFPTTGSRAEQTGLLPVPALLLPFDPLHDTLMVRHHLLQHDIPRLQVAISVSPPQVRLLGKWLPQNAPGGSYNPTADQSRPCITFQSKRPRDGWLLPRKFLRSFLFPS